MVTKSSTFWKHLRLSSGKVRRPIEILQTLDRSLRSVVWRKNQKLKEDTFGAVNFLTRMSHCSKKWKEGPVFFGIVLYFMLKVLDAVKIKYCVLIVNVHRAQKVDH